MLIFDLKQQLCLSNSGMLLFMQMGYTIWIHQEESFIRPSVTWPVRAADGRWWLVFMKTTWMESVLLVIAGLVSRAVTQTGLMVTGRGQTVTFGTAEASTSDDYKVFLVNLQP